MNYHVIWTDASFKQTRAELIEFSGSQVELARKLGDKYLQDLRNLPGLSGKNLLILYSDHSAVVYSKPGHTEGTVVVEKEPGESERALLRGLLGREI